MVVLMSGGFSTQLTNYVDAKEMSDSPLWSSKFLASSPDAVVKAHRDYIEAGSEIVTTNTFQASVDGFQKHLGIDYEASVNLIKEGVHLARKAIESSNTGRRVLIAGSVGPYGACLCDGSEYRGDYVERVSASELRAWHRPRVKALVEAGVDLLAVETIPVLEEAVAVLQLLRDEFPHAHAWLSFSCQNDSRTPRGELFHEAVAQCYQTNRSQLVAVGVNCLSPALVAPLLQSVQDFAHQVPFIVYPNSGEVWKPGIGYTKKEQCLPLLHYLPEWIKLGAKFVGGCCRTNADDIRQLREYLVSKNLQD